MTAKPAHVRTATLGDHDALVALFDEPDGTISSCVPISVVAESDVGC